jgi:hypothetical protein
VNSVAGRVGVLLTCAAAAVLAFGVVTVFLAVQSLCSATGVTGSLIPPGQNTLLLLTAFVDEETGERGYTHHR